MRELDINAVAKLTGVPAATLRFYEEKGLIKSIGRSGLRRVFAADVTERLALIALGRSAGFSLDQVARVFAPDGRTRINRRLLADKAKEIDATIKRLTAMREGLKHAASCPAPSHMECPTFRRLMREAAAEAKVEAESKQSVKRKRLV